MNLKHLKNTTIFVVIVLIDCFLITSLTTTLIVIEGTSLEIINVIANLFIGNFFGITIYGLTIVLAFRNDMSFNFSFKKSIQTLIYLAFFSIITSLLFISCT